MKMYRVHIYTYDQVGLTKHTNVPDVAHAIRYIMKEWKENGGFWFTTVESAQFVPERDIKTICINRHHEEE